jgi:hypothetical protein
MNIVAAILVLSASGHAERAVTVEDQQIAGIVARVIGGAVSDGLAQRTHGEDWSIARIYAAMEAADIRLTIDNQPRTGWKSWVEAVGRVARYAANGTSKVDGSGHSGTRAVERIPGSVGYSYRLRIRGYDVRRATQIQDGRVVLTTDAWWTEVVPVGRGTRRIPIHVTITITATERNQSTMLVGLATGTAGLADFRCGIIRRIAERQAAETLNRELSAALAGAERKATDLYLGSADLGPVLDGIGEAMRTVGPRIGRPRRG